MKEYFVIYDKDGNIVYYIDSVEELCEFTGFLKKYFNFRFKNTDNIQINIDNQRLNVYKFF